MVILAKADAGTLLDGPPIATVVTMYIGGDSTGPLMADNGIIAKTANATY